MITTLNYPSIDRLLDRFKEESKQFFACLSSFQRKELRKYLNYKKAAHKDNWSFAKSTVATLDLINHQAEQFYLERLKYTQLKLPIMPRLQCKDSVIIPRKH